MDRSPDVLWLDGTIVINGTDAGTINAAEGPVEIEINKKQITAAGSRAVDIVMDEVSTDIMVNISSAYFNMRMYEYLEGLDTSYGTLDDGMTASKNYTINNKAISQQRPYIELLIKGNKNGTINPNTNEPYKIEVWAGRAKLSGANTLSMQKEDYSKMKLSFKVLAEYDSSSNFFEIRDEELES